jgi:hypothetical protein
MVISGATKVVMQGKTMLVLIIILLFKVLF